MDENTEKYSVTTDEQIIELYWNRDEKAIKETEVKYGKMLFRIAYNILNDKSDCEECQNDTYLRIWHRIPPTRPIAFSPFISKIMRDIAIDRYKERMSKKRIPSELTVSLEDLCETLYTDDSPEAEYAVKELSQHMKNFVKSLPNRQYYIFIGRFYFGEKMEHIAGDLDISASTVQREIVKLKAGLKNYLERNGVLV